MTKDACLRQLSENVGDFIRYWGFRRIHGQIWVHLYLSKVPLSGADLVRKLKVSKALVSPGLSELEDYGLIRQEGGDGKTKLYMAEPDVFGVIRNILMTREREMITRSLESCRKVQGASKGANGEAIDDERVQKLLEMIESASAALDLILLFSSDNDIGNWLQLRKEIK